MCSLAVHEDWSGSPCLQSEVVAGEAAAAVVVVVVVVDDYSWAELGIDDVAVLAD